MIGVLLRFSHQERLCFVADREKSILKCFNMILKHFSMFRSTLSDVLLEKRHWGTTNLWNRKFYMEILLLHDLTTTSNEEHSSDAAAFIIPFPFGVRCLVLLGIQEVLIL